jgi:hypothetical protein
LGDCGECESGREEGGGVEGAPFLSSFSSRPLIFCEQESEFDPLRELRTQIVKQTKDGSYVWEGGENRCGLSFSSFSSFLSQTDIFDLSRSIFYTSSDGERLITVQWRD